MEHRVAVDPRIATGVGVRLQKLAELQKEIALIVDTIAANAGVVDGATFRAVDTDAHTLIFEVPSDD